MVKIDKTDLEKELLDDNFTCWSLTAADNEENLASALLRKQIEGDDPTIETSGIIGYDPYKLYYYDRIKENGELEDRAIRWIIGKKREPAERRMKLIDVSNIHDKDGEVITKNDSSRFVNNETFTPVVREEINNELFSKYDKFRLFRGNFFDNVKDLLEDVVLDYNTFNSEDSKLGINLVPVPKTTVSNDNYNLFGCEYIKVELLYTDEETNGWIDSCKGRIDELFVFDLNEDEIQQISENHPDKKILAHNIDVETFQNKFYKTILQSFDNELSAKDKMLLRRRKYNKIVTDTAKSLIEQTKLRNEKIAEYVVKNFNSNDLNKNYFSGKSDEIAYLSNTPKLAKKVLEKIFDLKKNAYTILKLEQNLIKENKQTDFYEFDKNMNELKETSLIIGFEAKNRKMGSILKKYENLKEQKYLKPIKEKPKTEAFSSN